MTDADWQEERALIQHRLQEHDDGIERLDKSVRSLHDAVIELKTTIRLVGGILAISLVAAQIVAQIIV